MAKCRSRSILNDETPTPEASCPAPAPANPSPQQLQQQQQNYLPQTSLLKIEPFVPSFNQRLRRRPIGRSHSTLSHNVIPKRPVQQQLQQQQQQQQQQQIQQHSELQVGQQQQLKRSYAAAAQIRQQQQQQQRNLPRGVGIQRQRSKSTSSSAASNSCRPATAAVTPNTLVGSTGGTLVSGAIVTPQPNGICRIHFLVSYLPLLQTLSQMPITEQVRRAALAWRQHKEQAQAAPGSSEAYHSIRREEVISNARTNWELLRSQQTVVGRPKSRLTSELAKINESNEGPTAEEETESEESQQPKELMDELQALIKLPPIAKNLRNPQDEDGVSSEASSLGPNVDSCSSCYSSDNEEGGAKNKPQTPQIDENCNKVGLAEKPPPSPVPAGPTNHSPDLVKVTTPTAVASSPSPPALTLTPPAAPGTPVPGGTSTPPPVATTATLPVPATASSNTSRPTSSKQRSRHAPITQLGLQINQRGGASASSKRYMAGSLVRAQTVSSSTSNSSSSNSNGRGKATNNGLTLVATQSKAVTSATSNQSSAGAGGGTAGSTTGSATGGTAAAPNAAITVSKPSAAEREREQGGDYLIEICGRYL
uniref:Basic-leucine zipper transcription factor A-like n=1 Tax=Drosophila rhopaloa TaxID=1041015 RepID=A0A6P4FMZ6_DRORH